VGQTQGSRAVFVGPVRNVDDQVHAGSLVPRLAFVRFCLRRERVDQKPIPRYAPTAFDRETEGRVQMLLFGVASAAERVERFLEAFANAGENRRIAQREA
jgi:hypothetical protein